MKNIVKEEKDYFHYVKESLEKEKEYCIKEMREIPNRYTNVLQGDAFLVEGLMTTQATKLRQLELSEKKPYFGRIDFLSDGSNNVAKVYIGKTTIHGDNNEIVTTDWRTPICSLYYDSDLGRSSYEAPSGIIHGDLKLKRQIIIENGEFIDAFDTSLVSNDELLQPYLSINADNKMKTIIASIQKEQNAIIRRPITENIIVQGVAGSGKTSVALHRIAYLVFNLEKKINSSQFLLIGPNNYFLNYISSILPELETDPVEQETYLNLINNLIKDKLVLDSNTVFNQKGNKEEYKKIQAFKTSLEYKKILDDFMCDYLSYGIVQEGFKINGEEIYTVEEIRKVLFSEINSYPNFDSASRYFVSNFKNHIEDIYSKLNQKYRVVYMSDLPKDNPIRKEAVFKSVELNNIIKNNGVKLIKNYFKKLELGILNIYKLFIANIGNYTKELSEIEIMKLQKETLLLLKKKKVSFEDLPALLHINNLLYGKNPNYNHIVIDEAQDYGLFHFDALKETFPNSTFSIYGDLAQSIYSYRGIKNWKSVATYIFDNNCSILNLNKSYRTTIEITDNANKVLRQMNLNEAEPVIRHGTNITFGEFAKYDEYKIAKINEWINKGYKTLAIICKTDKEAENVYNSLKKFGIDITHIKANDMEYNGGVFVLTSELSKGLEFDAVLINNASSKVYDENNIDDMHLLYVAGTRALHEMDILYDNVLCPVFFSEKKVDKSKTLVRTK
ncbi:MAG: RNA polymerase recycling motor HelD [bacterium]|nr:RNA polymerase recycling motor HelD [bacterium]